MSEDPLLHVLDGVQEAQTEAARPGVQAMLHARPHTLTYRSYVQEGTTTSYKHYFTLEELGLGPDATEAEMRAAFAKKYPQIDLGSAAPT